MNISKYCDFLLQEKVSKKTGKQYYCISIRFGDFEFPLVFLTMNQYQNMLQSLN